MKKILITIIAAALAMSLPVTTSAKPTEKEVDVTLTSSALSIQTGQSIILSAVTKKHGSTYEVFWFGAHDRGTQLSETNDSYISTAVFNADKPGIYTIRYSIIMEAGKSDRKFTGTAICTVNVSEPITVTGAEVRNLTFRPLTRPDGSIYAYSAMGDIYTVWSNNTSSLYGRTFFIFSSNETVKDVDVTLYIEDKHYRFTVTVSRQQ